MPRFLLTVTRTETYEVEIDAPDGETATAAFGARLDDAGDYHGPDLGPITLVAWEVSDIVER